MSMQLAPPISDPAAHEAWMKKRQRLLVYLTLVGVYISCHVLFRWLEFLLFDDPDKHAKNGEWFGWKLRGTLEFGYQVFTSLLPIALWCAAIFVGLTRSRRLTHCSLAFLVLIGGFVFL